VENGIALVKLMGRHSGYIAAGATMASQDVNFTLIPEIPVRLDGEKGFLRVLEERIRRRAHAVIVVAEGAGQELLSQHNEERDASGNVKLLDIGHFLRDRIEEHFQAADLPIVMRYFDPSYFVRSSPANSEDAILCDRFARNAVHAAMAGKTGLVIGWLHDRFIHVPIDLLTSRKKRLDPSSQLWSAVLSSTGQPESFE
jgi:6-phosphofructokinase 1